MPQHASSTIARAVRRGLANISRANAAQIKNQATMDKLTGDMDLQLGPVKKKKNQREKFDVANPEMSAAATAFRAKLMAGRGGKKKWQRKLKEKWERPA